MNSHKLILIVVFAVTVSVLMSGCFILEERLFPVWEENYFDEPPADLGPYVVEESRFEVIDGADGAPFGISIFKPVGVNEPLPAFIWVMGSNVQAYYHQSLHENLASWGYLVLVPDTRRLRFADFQYHNRIVLLALQTIDLAQDGTLGPVVDENRIAAGGYSVGAPLAAFTAAMKPEISALVYWAPSGAPFWQGFNARNLFPSVSQPTLYVLGELDDDAPAEGGYPSQLQASMPGAPFEVVVIEGATHHQFQQPVGADQFSNIPGISRFEQQGTAIRITREWLDEIYEIER